MSQVRLSDIQQARRAAHQRRAVLGSAAQLVPLRNGELLAAAVGGALKMPTLSMRDMQVLTPQFRVGALRRSAATPVHGILRC